MLYVNMMPYIYYTSMKSPRAGSPRRRYSTSSYTY